MILKKRMWLLSLCLSLIFVFPAFAGQWRQDMNGRWYQNDDSTYPRNGWHWIDGNSDGWAECYYFGYDGYVLTGDGHVDGYEVNVDGAWTVGGVIQEKEVDFPSSGLQQVNEAADAAYWKALDKNESASGMDMEYRYQIRMEYDGRQADLDLTMRLRGENFGTDRDPVYRVDLGITEGGKKRTGMLFYKDGYLYENYDGVKEKNAVDEYDAYSSVEEAIDLADDSRAFGLSPAMQQENGSTVIDYQVDIDEIGFITDGLMGLLAEQLTGYSYSDQYEMNTADGRAVVNSEGYLTSESYRIDGLFYNDQLPGFFHMIADFQILYHDPGKTVEVPVPSLDGY